MTEKLNASKRFADSVSALLHESEAEQIEKKAFTIGAGEIALGALLLGGASAGKKAIEANAENKYRAQYGNMVQSVINEHNKTLNDVGEDLYTQIENVEKDIRVQFSPISVVISLKGTVIETIQVEKMNDVMKNAFRKRDGEYFKNYVLNRMFLDAHQAELAFARRALGAQNKLFSDIKKEASADLDPVNFFGLVDEMSKFNMLLTKSASDEISDKVASIICDEMYTPFDVSIELDQLRHTANELDLGVEKLAFFRLNDKEPKEFMDKNYVKKNVVVSFLPDRVVFMVDGVVLTQVDVMGMNDDGFSKFKSRDVDYFENLFKSYVDSSNKLTKTAESVDYEEPVNNNIEEEPHTLTTVVEGPNDTVELIDTEIPVEDDSLTLEPGDDYYTGTRSLYAEAFKRDDTTPVTLLRLMNIEFESDWVDIDARDLPTLVVEHFGLDSLSDVIINKLLFIATVITSTSPYMGYHTFEKCVRAFNDKLIDFELRESNISLSEFVYAIRTMGNLINDFDDNVYDNFSDHVLMYMVEVLIANGVKVCAVPSNKLLGLDQQGASDGNFFRSQAEADFFELVNLEIRNKLASNLPDGFDDSHKGAGKEAFTNLQNIVKQDMPLVINDLADGMLDEYHAAAVNVGMTDVEASVVLDNLITNIGAAMVLMAKEEQEHNEAVTYGLEVE